MATGDGNWLKSQKSPPSKRSLVLLALYLLLFLAASASFLVMVWPDDIGSGNAATVNATTDNATGVWLFGVVTELNLERQLLCVVIAAGTLGGLLHALSSFVGFVGNRAFVRSWILWYVLRPFIGMALALVAYFAFRGVLFSAQAGAEAVSPYGFAALAALAGLFSKQTLDKLKEMLENLLPTGQDTERADKMRDKDRE